MDAYVSAVGKVEQALSHAVASVAKACARRPRGTIAVFLGVALGLIACFLGLMVTENNGNKLWVDQNSEPKQNLDYVFETFEGAPRLARLTITAKNVGSNVLTQKVMEEAFQVHEQVVAARTEQGSGYQDLCDKNAFGQCQTSGVLKFWQFNKTAFAQTATTDAAVAIACSLPVFPTGEPVQRSSEFAGFNLDQVTGGAASSATAFQLMYPLVSESADGSNTEQLEFELLFRDIGLQTFEHIDVFVEVARSIDDDLNGMIGADIHLMVIAFTTMIAFASVTLGRAGHKVKGRALMAGADVYVIFFATGAAFGFCTLLRIPFTSMTQILPFILLGVGIDSAYVLSAAFDRTSPSDDLADRVYEAVYDAGMSVTVASLTNFCAFMFTSLSALPSIQWFGLYAGPSVLFIYFAHMTVFPALLVLDAQRQQSNRADCLPCIVVAGAPEQEDGGSKPVGVVDSSDGAGLLQRFFRDWYAPVLLKTPVRATIILLFLGATGALAYLASSKLGTQFEVRELTPDDSYFREALDVREELWGTTIGSPLPTGLYYVGNEFSSAEFQATMRDDVVRVFTDTYSILSDFKVDWHEEFSLWAQASLPADALDPSGQFAVGANFSSAVMQWLELPLYKRFANDLVFTDGQLSACRIWFFHEPIEESEKNVKSLLAVQAATEASKADPKPFMVTFSYMFWDQYRIIIGETLWSVGLAVVSVCVVAMLLLVHPLQVLILVGVLAMVFVDLVGLLPVWGLQLNSISSINLILSIGLVVDYLVHIAHSFGTQSPSLSREERVQKTLAEMAPSVFLGVTTTFLGVLPLGFAGAQTFRVFFQMFVSIVVVGGLHGLVFLPAVLSFIGPAIHYKNNDHHDKSKDAVVAPAGF